jgi:hypothetical protein
MASTASPQPEPPAPTQSRDPAGFLAQPAEPAASPVEPRIAGPGIEPRCVEPSPGRTPSTSAKRRAARPRAHRGATTRARSAIPTTVWTAPGHSMAGTGDRAWTSVGRIMAAFPDRAPNAIVLTAEHIAAHPYAPAPTAAQPPPTPAADVPGAAGASGAAMATLGPHPGVAPPATRGAASQGSAEPFWADMISPADSASTTAPSETSSTGQRHPGPTMLDQTSTGAAAGPGRERVPAIGRLAASHPGGERVHRWDLVVVDLGCRLCGDGLGLLGANLLAPGGVLAVLTHSERRGGRLIDPTGSVVASAQAADLLYLQHIVVLTAPLPTPHSGAAPGAGRPPTDPQPEPAGDPASEESAPGHRVMDLLLFLQPSDPHPSSAPADPLANVTPGDPPGAEPVADPSPAAHHVMNGDRA